ncbi:hypothetical protein VNO78_18033 [Psophocarpus tetragonolobus]|uniref:Uncharacterized protein n=1 Tax=Psophocarpus tetragonolobus TaxID=3891 RepID=A0AAN9SI22_PSOTE
MNGKADHNSKASNVQGCSSSHVQKLMRNEPNELTTHQASCSMRTHPWVMGGVVDPVIVWVVVPGSSAFGIRKLVPLKVMKALKPSDMTDKMSRNLMQTTYTQVASVSLHTLPNLKRITQSLTHY